MRVTIHDFGPIEDLAVDIQKFNLLIGEQAVGKSTICKVIYCFRRLRDDLLDRFMNLYNERESLDTFEYLDYINSKPYRENLLRLLGQMSSVRMTAHLRYDISPEKNIQISVRSVGKNPYYYVEFSKALDKQIKQAQDIVKASVSATGSAGDIDQQVSERLHMRQVVQKSLGDAFGDDMNTFYIPAGRSMLSLLAGQSSGINMDQLDLVSSNYIRYIEVIRLMLKDGWGAFAAAHAQNEGMERIEQSIESIRTGMKGEYINRDGIDYLKVDEKTLIPMNYTSSGQQEVLWVFNELLVLMAGRKGSFVIIEEPEAHIYPTLQYRLMSFITSFANETGSTVIITTHSPYMLTSFNLLGYAGYVEEKTGNQKAVSEIIGYDNSIYPGSIMAGKLVKEDGVTQLIDLTEDTNELKTEMIDEITSGMDIAYTRLFQLENQGEENA